MDESTKIVREFYDSQVDHEWARIDGRPEFLLTCRMLDRYIKPGDRVADIGGGPGRYSLYLTQKGCSVALLDLSGQNTAFAAARAAEASLPLKTMQGDARQADQILQGPFDHVLLMGPMYHLLEEADREQAVRAALALLKPGGLLFASFINMFAGVIFAMKQMPESIAWPGEEIYYEAFIANKSYAGKAFTEAFFIQQHEVLPFMARFPLEKLHLFGQEGITSPCEYNIMGQPKDIVDKWLGFCERVWEREDLLSFSEHIMYVGRKI